MIKTILQEFFYENDKYNNESVLNYWISLKLRNIQQLTQEPHSETIPTFLQKPVKTILFLIKNTNLSQNTTTKEIYNVLNREIIKKSKNFNEKPKYRL